MVRASGCRVWDADGREYVDYVMALGAVALGYGHPAVNRAAEEAIAAGVVGPLPPVLEEELAEALCHRIPWIERVRFLKTGAEAVAAAVRLARVVTGRERVLGCGYHGWLDWCQGAEGVPAATRALYAELQFNDPERTRSLIRGARDRVRGAGGGRGVARGHGACQRVRAPARRRHPTAARAAPAAPDARRRRHRCRWPSRDVFPPLRQRAALARRGAGVRGAGAAVQADRVQLRLAGARRGYRGPHAGYLGRRPRSDRMKQP